MTEERLRADLVLEYPFTRTTGPVIGAFLTGLREQIICGIKRADGTVLVPPVEYDPATSAPLTEMVEVGQSGQVVSWTWVDPPRPQSPWSQPHALALITLDGADTPMLHAVLVGSSAEMASGMRVTARWRAEREGHISDLEGFVPEEAGS
ncbi:MAG: OB-fold domain-containing protein [Acidimicrobiia bacterium]|nr:OB-fold domain-containing protein [Acidimicrobiia bacterium]MDH5237564.1 OB-fold domain-containing protein [Acidimicrobiia bacterium]